MWIRGPEIIFLVWFQLRFSIVEVLYGLRPVKVEQLHEKVTLWGILYGLSVQWKQIKLWQLSVRLAWSKQTNKIQGVESSQSYTVGHISLLILVHPSSGNVLHKLCGWKDNIPGSNNLETCHNSCLFSSPSQDMPGPYKVSKALWQMTHFGLSRGHFSIPRGHPTVSKTSKKMKGVVTGSPLPVLIG